MSTTQSDWREGMARAIRRRTRLESRTRLRWFVLVAALALLLDQATKILVRSRLDLGERHELLPFLTMQRTRNEGIAFGLFPDNRQVVTVVTFAAMCGIGLALVALLRRHPLVLVGGGALVGGALGNLIDRLRFGGVTDFIKVPHFPNFNLADSAITVGACLIVVGLWRTGEPDDQRA